MMVLCDTESCETFSQTSVPQVNQKQRTTDVITKNGKIEKTISHGYNILVE